jgi:hypothetical protein
MRDSLWRRSLAVSFCLVAAAGVVPSGAQELDPAFRADIVKLMEVTGGAKMGEQMASMVSSSFLEGLEKAQPDVPPRAFEIVQEILEAEFAAGFDGPDGLIAKMIPIYAKYLDHEEVRGLLAFYESELGRKTIAVMPSLMQEGAQVGEAWAEEIMPRVEKRIRERMKAEGLDE